MVTASGERRKGRRRKESLIVANEVVNLGRTSPGEQPEFCSMDAEAREFAHHLEPRVGCYPQTQTP